MFLRICRRFDVDPSEALYVGDLEIDREAAMRAGMAFAWRSDYFGARSGSS